MKYIDNFLNNITMYRLLLYGLWILALISVGLSFTGAIFYLPLQLVIACVILLVVSWITNYLFGILFDVPTNVESVYITALILFFVLIPALEVHDMFILAAAAFIAQASKYLLVINRKHVFNPVAIAAVILGLFGVGASFWWVANVWLIIPVSIFGFLILRKIHRFSLFFVYAITAIVIYLVRGTNIGQVIISYPLVFLGTVMLTEPLTNVPTRRLQIIYGIIVGALFALPFHFAFHFGAVYSTPELALVLGNIFSYLVSPKYKIQLRLDSIKKLSNFIYDFSFVPKKKFAYEPGQYMEWTLAPNGADTRGNRRYFTLASSPTEPNVHLGVRIDPAQASSYKKNLLTLKPEDTLLVSSLSGEFTMPKDTKQKLVFLAGGIGITPFRSMIKYLIDTNEKRDIIMMYSVKTEDDIAYKEIFDEAEAKMGIKIKYVVTDRDGFINQEMIEREVADFRNRMFYISGPGVMVTAFEKTLAKMGVAKKQIKKDYFPGF